ncbi:expressed unknown protein [Seminavis robusta]|uniref:Uncharacterized protein n=1 Tax=Seminavis robusta TaxID=568900 RepID=A0A9N8HY25_9STRA|nr:expressed unknown protein [Seminavis robusta]|eukprot:Sro1918_g305380.1 n/a (598) ;mRNA; f:7237-9124
MANRMLEGDFKSSHPDLTIWMDTDDNGKNSKFSEEKSNKESYEGIGGGNGIIRKDSNGILRKRSSGDMRTVSIQVPHKRRRMDPSLSTRRLVHEIGTSSLRDDRMAVLKRAKSFLDHNDAAAHNDEIAAGIDVALVKQLVLLVLKVSRCRATTQLLVPVEDEDIQSLVEEVCTALEVLEMVYRAGDEAIGASFLKIGPDLLHVLVTVIDDELNSRRVSADQYKADHQTSSAGDDKNVFRPIDENQSKDEKGEDHTTKENRDNGQNVNTGTTTPTQSHETPLYLKEGTPEGNFLILKATKVMGHLARVGKATKPMAFFPGLVRGMLNLINYQPHESVPWEARLSALWILGNLACNPESMQMMMCTPSLVRSLVRVGCRALHPDDPMEVTMEVLRSRALSSRALLNLSWKPENKIPLADNLALVELLTQLAVHRKAPALNSSKTVKGILTQTRCHAVGALRNLAAAPRRTKIQLCEYRNGHVLDALTDVALNDPDPSIQTRAFAAINNLAVHDTATKMVERPALVLALKDVLLEDDSTSIGKEGSPRSHASATLLVLERSITPEMNAYQNLRDLLDAVNPTVASDNEDDSSEHVTAIEV